MPLLKKVTKMTLGWWAWLTVELLEGLCHFQAEKAGGTAGAVRDEEVTSRRRVGKSGERPQGLPWRQ